MPFIGFKEIFTQKNQCDSFFILMWDRDTPPAKNLKMGKKPRWAFTYTGGTPPSDGSKSIPILLWHGWGSEAFVPTRPTSKKNKKIFGRKAIPTKYPHALPIGPRREPRALLQSSTGLLQGTYEPIHVIDRIYWKVSQRKLLNISAKKLGLIQNDVEVTKI